MDTTSQAKLNRTVFDRHLQTAPEHTIRSVLKRILFLSGLGVCRFFQSLRTLVSCSLLGPTSPLAFAESVLGTIGRSASLLQNKEHLWRMWSLMVIPLTDTITQVGGAASQPSDDVAVYKLKNGPEFHNVRV